MKRLRVFLSHSSDDKPRVRELSSRLRAEGFDPWLDEERLLPGDDWELEILEAVRECDVVIVCLSAQSVSKVGFVQEELRRVMDVAEQQPEGRVFVIPVRLEPCEIPLRLGQWQYADLFADGGYERLRTALHAKQAGRDAPPYIAPARSYRKFALAIAAVAGAALLSTLLVWRRPPADTTAATAAEPPGMAHVRGGRFLMGLNGGPDPEASPAHEVTVESFYLDRTPVTVAQFHGPGRQASPADWPVSGVTWDEAYAYCVAQGKRLPREAEWEFAARGSVGRLYPWGDVFDPTAVNSREAGIGHPEPVGSRAGNRTPLGIADMSGNVWQWTADDYHPYTGRTPSFSVPPGAKVIRGGSFQSDRNNVSAVARNLERPATRSPSIGFRCAK